MKYRHAFLQIVCFLIVAGAAQAQEKSSGVRAAFDKNSITGGIGLGFGNVYGYNALGWGWEVKHRPGIAAIFDMGVADVGPGTIGAGGILAYQASVSKDGTGDNIRWSNVIIAVRSTYHLNLLKDKNNKFDPYAGVVLGLRFHRISGSAWGAYGMSKPAGVTRTVAGLFAGARYKFTEQFSAFAELGYDVSYLRLGVNYQFR